MTKYNRPECVDRGARLLDVKVPGWHTKVTNTGRLEGPGILKALFSKFEAGVTALGLATESMTGGNLEALENHGILVVSDVTLDNLVSARRQMRELWRDEIECRLDPDFVKKNKVCCTKPHCTCTKELLEATPGFVGFIRRAVGAE